MRTTEIGIPDETFDRIVKALNEHGHTLLADTMSSSNLMLLAPYVYIASQRHYRAHQIPAVPYSFGDVTITEYKDRDMTPDTTKSDANRNAVEACMTDRDYDLEDALNHLDMKIVKMSVEEAAMRAAKRTMDAEKARQAEIAERPYRFIRDARIFHTVGINFAHGGGKSMMRHGVTNPFTVASYANLHVGLLDNPLVKECAEAWDKLVEYWLTPAQALNAIKTIVHELKGVGTGKTRTLDLLITRCRYLQDRYGKEAIMSLKEEQREDMVRKTVDVALEWIRGVNKLRLGLGTMIIPNQPEFGVPPLAWYQNEAGGGESKWMGRCRNREDGMHRYHIAAGGRCSACGEPPLNAWGGAI